MRSHCSRSSLPCPIRVLGALGLLLLMGGLPAGCKLFRKTVEFPGKALNSGSGSSSRASPSRVQTSVMRFADTFNTSIVHATNEFSQLAGTPEARIQALSWRVVYMTSALTIASGSNSNASTLDMLVLVTLGRMVHEEYWMPEVWGEADRPMVDAFTMLEGEMWEVAELRFSQSQLEKVRETIDEWREEHPGKALTAFVRLPGFRLLLQGKAKDKKTDVFKELADLLSIDPFEGLAPATREAAELRDLGERTLFYAQRAPLVFQAQAELLTLKTAQLPEVKQVIEEGDRISLAAGSLAETAKELPDKLIAGLESAREPAVALLTEARTTMDAGKEMSSEVRQAITTLDEFIARVTPDKEAGDSKTPGRKFDVRDYGEAAARVGEAAKELDQLIAHFDEKLPEVKAAVEEVAGRTDRTVDRAMIRFLLVGLVLVAAAAGAAMLVKRTPARRQPSPQVGAIQEPLARRLTANGGVPGHRVER